MRRPSKLLTFAFFAAALGAAFGYRSLVDARNLNQRVLETVGSEQVIGEVWVDNWFRLAVNGKPLIEDSVPYMTERSFNAERVTFRADLPMTLAFEFRDFKEDDTGLEYIGSDRQQVGDGGAIAQFTRAETGEPLAVTDSSWRCRVIHRAPKHEDCSKERRPQVGQGSCAAAVSSAPEGWMEPDFDDTAWAAATVHSVDEVRPKDGYESIRWIPTARLIWSQDLRLDNTVLCRATVGR